ncbi:MAG: SpoIIIAH-like family protein [Firmicutes bacterium]|nr:SpoIIIAH-like family protein [Bacillota bacterium]
MELKAFQPGIIPVLIILIIFFLIGFFGLLHSWFDPASPPAPPLEVPVVAVDPLGYDSLIADFRLTRDRERSRLQEQLTAMLATADQTETGKLQEELLILMKRQTLEAEIENLLKAKGYAYSAVAVYPETITIIIKGRELNAALVADLGELVTNVTGYRAEQLRILE